MASYHALFLCVILCAPVAYSKSGLVELDESTFDKILNKFDAALVKFDVSYPYGSKHDAYLDLAKETKEVDEILVADVNVKDYGDKENAALAARYGVTKDDFPVVKLFVKGKKEPINFDETATGFTTEALRKFVEDSTGLLLSLPGCVRKLDLLAIKFIKAESERAEVLKEAEEAVKSLGEDKKLRATGEFYLNVMKRILDNGVVFINTESERLRKILKGKISEEKTKELEGKLNIIQSFLRASSLKERKKEEL